MVFGIRSRKADPAESEIAGVEPMVHDGSDGSEHNLDSKAVEATGVHHHNALSDEEAARRLRLYREQAVNDPNLPVEELGAIDQAVDGHDVAKENYLVEELVENSPYPEVQAAVRNYDVDLPANTIRAWTIGMLMTTIFSGMNMLFSLRQPSIIVSSYVAQLVAYPVGMGWSYILPDREWRIGSLKFNLSPGPFNYKEHAMIVLMANAAYGGGAGYFTDILTAQKAFYGVDLGWGYAILLGLTSQCIGFGMAGLVRRFLVEPANMIWPQNLVNTAFMYTLHDHSATDPAKTNGWAISRYRYFFIVFVGAFCWYWFPGFIWQNLSVFAFPTFIAANNVNVNKVFGGFTGMALLPITFDWTQIAGYVGSPLIPPWHALANTSLGVVLWFWIIAPAIHWTNTWYSDFLPFSDDTSYDNTQQPYNVSRILTADNRLDLEAYNNYSPLFLSTTFALAYGLSFAGISAVIVHAALFYSKEIWIRFRDTDHTLDDIHASMMRKYRQAPQWWFAAIFIICFALCFPTAYVWDTGLTWWAIIVAMLIALVWLIPIGIIQAITNIQLGLNVFTEFLAGYMLPGRPFAMMMFKTYGYITMTQALAFVQDMKLGHYLKLPPRTMFFGQVIATIWSVFVQIAVFYWALGTFKDVCTPDAQAHFTCPNGSVFFTASVIWGLIGPQRIFTGTGLYKNLMYFWLAGVAMPLIFWLVQRRYPKSFVRYLNAPVIFSGSGLIPPATPLNYLSWGIVGFIFNKWIRDRWRGWWMRFNYITSAGLDSGLAISTIIIVLTISLTNTSAPDWWGNSSVGKTLDAQDAALFKVLQPGETFGPASW